MKTTNKQYFKQYHIDNREKILACGKQWRINNPEKYRKSARQCALKRKYNITINQYNELFNKQEGKCAICGRHQSELKQTLGIDHDHETGKIRGLLCRQCNLILGNVNDDSEVLLKAANYMLVANENETNEN